MEVASDHDAVSVGGTEFPVSVVRKTSTSVELEIAGERVLIENWPEHFAEPPGPVDVNGERWRVRIERGPGGAAPRTAGRPAAPSTAAPSAAAPAAASPAGGLPIVPPMPGKVIELRVKEGDRVRKGDVLLVLEAMKMRNELTSPADGRVRGVAVVAGSNARAKEPMLFVVPEPSTPGAAA